MAAPDLALLLTDDSRFAGDRERDAGRMPADVVAFLGIEPGMNVIDIIAAGGYYTEVLSLAVGAEGHVAAQNPAVILKMRDGVNEKQLSERLANGRLANVSRLDKELAELVLEDGPFDAALTALNLHDVYNNYGEPGAIGAMKTIAATLRPGAVFGVIDHQGADGNDNKELHRIRVEDAIRVSELAGFVVEAQSDLLQVQDDDWTGSVFADGRRGNTDRFVLRLRKPE
jgi:predicted methyltransferase